jgi:hypothetical protein
MDTLAEVLDFLGAVAVVTRGDDGRVRWGLDPADICVLLELGHELAINAEESNRLYEALQ